jgi:uncharacterized iron-regulated membrane protein
MKPTNDEQRDGRRVSGQLRARRNWLTAHRWLGLTVGLVFVLIGLTGSLLVFDHAIDEWLNPNLLLTEGSGQRKSIADVVAAAEQAFDPSQSQAAAVSRPRVENGVWTVWFASGTANAPTFTAVYVDPYSASTTGQRVWGEDLMTWIYRLHFQMLAGRIGSIAVGIIGILVVISILSGVYLWWPLWKNSLRAAFAIRRGRRFSYDLHKTFGIVSAGVLLVITFTGVYMEFPDAVNAVAKVFVTVSDTQTAFSSSPDGAKQPLSPDEALAIAQKSFPDATFDHLHPPDGNAGAYEVAFRQADEIQQSFGRSQVFLDQYSGEVIAIREPADFTAADAFFAWQFPLHNGEAFGLVGRWVVLFFGLTPAILYTTGVLVWWRKRQSKRRIPQESASVANTVSSERMDQKNEEEADRQLVFK